MMNILQAVILSVVEGITEFLPVSSTGHLILASQLIGVAQTDFAKSFEIIIQLGAILAVIVVFWQRLMAGKAVWTRVIAAFIPTGIVGFVLYKVVKNLLLGNQMLVVWMLAIGGIILILFEKYHSEADHHIERIEDMSIKHAVYIGLIQAISIVPGVSRSAATIVGGMMLGYKRIVAVEFSFLLAIPTMIMASGYDILKNRELFTFDEAGILAVGFIGSFLVAWVVIKYFLKYIQTHTLAAFGWYRIVAALLFWWIVIR